MSVTPHDQPPYKLEFDQAELFATALTPEQLEEAMRVFDNIRPSYSDIRAAFVEAIRLQLLAVAKELGI
jgi:hypothetical protein